MYLRETLEVTRAIKDLIPRNTNQDDIIFFCIGTDRSTGDSLGPLVGTKLKEMGYSNVVGTLHDPAHALNLEAKFNALPKDKLVIAIDACLGQAHCISTIVIDDTPIKPGAAVKKELPPIGDISIKGIVNIGGFMEHNVLQSTRLSIVVDLVNIITESISIAAPIENFKTDLLSSNIFKNLPLMRKQTQSSISGN